MSKFNKNAVIKEFADRMRNLTACLTDIAREACAKIEHILEVLAHGGEADAIINECIETFKDDIQPCPYCGGICKTIGETECSVYCTTNRCTYMSGNYPRREEAILKHNELCRFANRAKQSLGNECRHF